MQALGGVRIASEEGEDVGLREEEGVTVEEKLDDWAAESLVSFTITRKPTKDVKEESDYCYFINQRN